MKTLMLGLLLLLAAGASASAATVSLKERAETSGPYVRLGEVAEIRGGDPLWADIFLGPAPAAGESRRITREAVRARMAYLGLAAGMEGAEEVDVRLGRPEAATLADEIIRRLRTLGLVPAGDMGLGETPAELIEVKAAALADEAKVRLREKASGRERMLTVKVQKLRKVVVIVKDLRTGRLLSPEDLGLQELPEKGLPRVCFQDPDGCLGKRLVKPLKAGAVLDPSSLQLPRSIARGSLCTLVQSSPQGLRITCQATALMDGKLGELIPFEIPDSGKRVRARVLGDGEASMENDGEDGR